MDLLFLWFLGIDILFSVNLVDISFVLWCGFLYVFYYLVLKDVCFIKKMYGVL